MNRMRLLLGLLSLLVLAIFARRTIHWLAQSPVDQRLTQQTSNPPDPRGIDSSRVDSTHSHQGQLDSTLPENSTRPPSDNSQRESDPLIPPIDLRPYATHDFNNKKPDRQLTYTLFAPDTEATFEPHGHKVCASGCALSHHATSKLSEARFLELLGDYRVEAGQEGDRALETLLFYGPQTLKLLRTHEARLDQRRSLLLRQQLQFTHAQVSLRLNDHRGTLRAWIAPTIVPLDRRHVFEMRTTNMPPQIVSGTVKRVGLNHLWTRL